jgi:hypothetical protein
MKYRLIENLPRLPLEIVEDDYKFCYSIPDKTEWEYRHGKQEKVDLRAPKNYPGTEATSNWNNYKRSGERAERTREIHRRITVRDLNTLPASHYESRVAEIRAAISKLRPGRAALAAAYLRKGTSPTEISLLLQNYEQLPGVKISQPQYDFLMKALEGEVDSAVVQKDFRV